MYQSPTLLLLLLSIALIGCSPEQEEHPIPPAPNILLIVADDLGFTDLGCYGSEIRTPTLDLLASTGIRNTAFYTAPTCSPTRSMLYTGVDNHRTGYGTMEGDWADNQAGVRGYEGYLNYDVVTFPKLLQDHGYHTTIAGKWHQALPSTEETLWPGKRGFERSFCLLQGGAGHFEDQQKLFNFFDRTYYTENDQYVETLPAGFYSTDFYTDKTIAYIQEARRLNKPFMSCVTYTAPHWPLQVPDEYIDLYRGRYDEGYEVLAAERFSKAQQLGVISPTASLPPLARNALHWEDLSPEEQQVSARTMEIYAAMIERLDANVGRLIDHLKSTGQYENTLIIFMADNGAEGNDVGSIVDTREWIPRTFDNSLDNIGRANSYVFTGPAWAQVSALPFRWYKGFSSEGGVRCPMIINYPALESNPDQLNDAFISVMDLAPTFLELAGVEHPGTNYAGREIYPMDGKSLMPWLSGKAKSVHAQEEAHCWELYGRRAVRKGDWKLEWMDAPYGEADWELYNLRSDPGELLDLAAVESTKLAELIAIWDEYEERYELVLPNEHVAYGRGEVWREE